MNERPLTAEEIAPLLGLPSAAAVNRLARNRVIPQIKIGWRTRRYDLESCRAAIVKRTVKEV